MPLPDYQGHSIVNLMSSLSSAMGQRVNDYPPLINLDQQQLRQNQNIILLVIDGLGYEYLMNHAHGSVMHQHLHGKMTSVFPSTTATAITSFMTGLAPQQHGLTGWFTYLKELACVTAVLPFRPRVGGSTFKTDDIDTRLIYDHVPIFDLLNRTSYIVAPEWIIHSEYNKAHSGSALLSSYHNMSTCFNTIANLIKGSKDKKYIYAYWPDFDRYSHESGCQSSDVHQHFARLDEAFEHLIHKLKGTDTSLLLTADHGFIDTEPDRVIHLHHHPEIQDSLVLPLCGEPRAAYCYIHPDKEQQFVSYIESALSNCLEIKASKKIIEGGYFGAGECHPGLKDRVGHYTLLMKENYIIKDRLIGEPAFAHIGVHGGISPEEMYVPLILAHC